VCRLLVNSLKPSFVISRQRIQERVWEIFELFWIALSCVFHYFPFYLCHDVADNNKDLGGMLDLCSTKFYFLSTSLNRWEGSRHLLFLVRSIISSFWFFTCCVLLITWALKARISYKTTGEQKTLLNFPRGLLRSFNYVPEDSYRALMQLFYPLIYSLIESPIESEYIRRIFRTHNSISYESWW